MGSIHRRPCSWCIVSPLLMRHRSKIWHILACGSDFDGPNRNTHRPIFNQNQHKLLPGTTRIREHRVLDKLQFFSSTYLEQQ